MRECFGKRSAAQAATSLTATLEESRA